MIVKPLKCPTLEIFFLYKIVKTLNLYIKWENFFLGGGGGGVGGRNFNAVRYIIIDKAVFVGLRMS